MPEPEQQTSLRYMANTRTWTTNKPMLHSECQNLNNKQAYITWMPEPEQETSLCYILNAKTWIINKSMLHTVHMNLNNKQVYVTYWTQEHEQETRLQHILNTRFWRRNKPIRYILNTWPEEQTRIWCKRSKHLIGDQSKQNIQHLNSEQRTKLSNTWNTYIEHLNNEQWTMNQSKQDIDHLNSEPV